LLKEKEEGRLNLYKEREWGVIICKKKGGVDKVKSKGM